LRSTQGKSAADYAMAGMHATSALLHYSDYGSAAQEQNQAAEQLRMVDAQAATLDVSSPISGVVLTPRVGDRLGSYVNEGAELAEIGDLTSMKARMFVSEYDVHRLQVGAAARVMVRGSTRKWNTTVEAIAQRSSEMDRDLTEPEKLKG